MRVATHSKVLDGSICIIIVEILLSGVTLGNQRSETKRALLLFSWYRAHIADHDRADLEHIRWEHLLSLGDRGGALSEHDS